MDPTTEQLIAELIQYSMHDIDWDFNHLSREEKAIIRSPKNLELIRNWMEAQ